MAHQSFRNCTILRFGGRLFTSAGSERRTWSTMVAIRAGSVRSDPLGSTTNPLARESAAVAQATAATRDAMMVAFENCGPRSSCLGMTHSDAYGNRFHNGIGVRVLPCVSWLTIASQIDGQAPRIAGAWIAADLATDESYLAKQSSAHGFRPRAGVIRQNLIADLGCTQEDVVSSIRSTRFAREGPGSNGSAKYCVSCATRPSRNSMMLTV
jgi:hypothetical protein